MPKKLKPSEKGFFFTKMNIHSLGIIYTTLSTLLPLKLLHGREPVPSFCTGAFYWIMVMPSPSKQFSVEEDISIKFTLLKNEDVDHFVSVPVAGPAGVGVALRRVRV